MESKDKGSVILKYNCQERFTENMTHEQRIEETGKQSCAAYKGEKAFLTSRLSKEQKS
jgi:hypothetical protein